MSLPPLSDSEIGQHLAGQAAHLRAMAERAASVPGRTALRAAAEVIDKLAEAFGVTRHDRAARH